jgi:hypothetical protein
VIRRPNPFLQVVEDFNSFADAMAKKQYWRTPCEASMKSRIRAPLLGFSQIVRYPCIAKGRDARRSCGAPSFSPRGRPSQST